MAYVKVAVKKKTGPKPKAKPVDPVELMTTEERLEGLKNACKNLINQFKENDSTMKQVHTTASKIKNYNLEEIKNAGMNPEYFRIVSNKADGLTVERFIEMIPECERDRYLDNEDMISQYIKTIKDNGTAMVNKANTIRDLIKEVKRYDVSESNKAKIIIDYYRKIYNAKRELESAIASINSDTNVNDVLDNYDFIKDLYLED